MDMNDYLSQSFCLDRRIRAKLGEIASLNKLSSDLSETEPGVARRLAIWEQELRGDLDSLIELRRSITNAIASVSDPACRTLLELHYLCFETWEQVAEEMNYSVQHVYRLRGKALSMVRLPGMRADVLE